MLAVEWSEPQDPARVLIYVNLYKHIHNEQDQYARSSVILEEVAASTLGRAVAKAAKPCQSTDLR